MLKFIIFDLDGLLVDSENINIQSGIQTFKQFNYDLSESDIALMPGSHSKDFVPKIIKNNNLVLSANEIIEIYRKKYGELWEEMIVLMPFAKEAVRAVKDKNLLVGLATNSNLTRVQRFISKFCFENMFSVIVTEEEVSQRKPNPDIYLTAIKKIDLPIEDIIAVEDSAFGVISAKTAGLKCFAIPNQYTKNGDFSQADKILNSLKELIGLI